MAPYGDNHLSVALLRLVLLGGPRRQGTSILGIALYLILAYQVRDSKYLSKIDDVLNPQNMALLTSK